MNLDTNVPKELVEKAYQAVETARKKGGKIKKGVNEATKAVERGTAKLVLIAKDVNPKEVVMHIPMLCKEKETPFIIVGSKEELGAAAGLTVSTSAVVILNEGETKEGLKDLADKLKDL